MRRGADRRVRRLVLAVALVVPLLESPALADVTCTYSDGRVLLSIDGLPYVLVFVGRTAEGEIHVDFDPCTGNGETATVTNTDVIKISDETEGRAATIDIDLGNGGFRPGATSETTGESEIEIVHEVSPETGAGALTVRGTDDSDRITLGSTGVETNGDGDVDISFEEIAVFEVYARAGDDLVSARGDVTTGRAAVYQAYLRGGDGNDRLIAGDWFNTLEGDAGNDTLEGAGGSDYFAGGAGADLIDGGEGEDTSTYRDSPSGVTIDLSTSMSSGGDAEGDTLFDIEDVFSGDHDDVLIGDSSSNYLSGGGGDDRLEGRAGDDRLQGDRGADLKRGEDGNDVLEEGHELNGPDDLYGGSGSDSASYTLRTEPVSVTRDDIANDGEAGENDNVHSDIEYGRTVDDPGPDDYPSPTSSGSPSPSSSGSASPSPSGSTSPSPSPTRTPEGCRERWSAIDDDGSRSGHWLNGIAVRGSERAWAVGFSERSQTLIEHWNGNAWQRQPSPTYRGQSSGLSDVDAPRRGPVWAVGDHSRTTMGTIALRRSGGRWRNMQSPDPGAGLSALNGVSVTPNGVAYAVGTRWDAAGRHLVLIERWRDGKWSVAPVAMEGILEDVYARRPNDVWAVGVTVRNDTARTLTLRFNGRRWRKIPSPNASSKPHFLRAVDGRGRKDVWAVGYRFGKRTREQPISMRWRRGRWKLLRTPALGRGGYGELTAVSAWREDVVAIGEYSNRRDAFQILVTSWRDGRWRLEDMSRLGDSVHLQDVDHAPNGELFAAGYRSTRNGSEVILRRTPRC